MKFRPPTHGFCGKILSTAKSRVRPRNVQLSVCYDVFRVVGVVGAGLVVWCGGVQGKLQLAAAGSRIFSTKTPQTRNAILVENGAGPRDRVARPPVCFVFVCVCV